MSAKLRKVLLVLLCSLAALFALAAFTACGGDVAVESITLDKTSLTMDIYSNEQLQATINPDNASNQDVVWTSSDETVVTVNGGYLYACDRGTATVTATSVENENISATCTVTVNKPVTGLQLNTYSEYINEGETLQLIASAVPSDATNADEVTISWSSDNESVATVSSDGLVTATGEGQASIIASYGDYVTSCWISVTGLSRVYQSLLFDAVAATRSAANMTVTVNGGEVWRYVNDSESGVYYFERTEDADGTLYAFGTYGGGCYLYEVYKYDMDDSVYIKFTSPAYAVAEDQLASMIENYNSLFYNVGVIVSNCFDFTLSEGVYSGSMAFDGMTYSVTVTLNEDGLIAGASSVSDNGTETYVITYGTAPTVVPSYFDSAVDISNYDVWKYDWNNSTYGSVSAFCDLFISTDDLVGEDDFDSALQSLIRSALETCFEDGDLVGYADDGSTMTEYALDFSEIPAYDDGIASGEYHIKVTATDGDGNEYWGWVKVNIGSSDDIYSFDTYRWYNDTEVEDLVHIAVNETEGDEELRLYLGAVTLGAKAEGGYVVSEKVDATDCVTAIYKLANYYAHYSSEKVDSVTEMLTLTGVYMVYFSTAFVTDNVKIYVYDPDDLQVIEVYGASAGFIVGEEGEYSLAYGGVIVEYDDGSQRELILEESAFDLSGVEYAGAGHYAVTVTYDGVGYEITVLIYSVSDISDWTVYYSYFNGIEGAVIYTVSGDGEITLSEGYYAIDFEDEEGNQYFLYGFVTADMLYTTTEDSAVEGAIAIPDSEDESKTIYIVPIGELTVSNVSSYDVVYVVYEGVFVTTCGLSAADSN